MHRASANQPTAGGSCSNHLQLYTEAWHLVLTTGLSHPVTQPQGLLSSVNSALTLGGGIKGGTGDFQGVNLLTITLLPMWDLGG